MIKRKGISKVFLILFSLSWFFSPAVFARSAYPPIIIKHDQIVSIYDADTFKVNIKNYPPIIGKNISIRAKGFDAPEIRGKCKAEKQLAQEAKRITVNALRNAQQIKLLNVGRGKYFRIVADVVLDGINLKDLQFKAKTAVPYNKGKKINWCDFISKGQ